jgi:hypothetical protein
MHTGQNNMQPKPKLEGVSVPDKLIEWISNQNELPKETISKGISLIQQRDAFGRQKYGQPLMTMDGRKTMVDALEELGDLLQYLYKAKLNHEDCSEIKTLIPILNTLIADLDTSTSST